MESQNGQDLSREAGVSSSSIRVLEILEALSNAGPQTLKELTDRLDQPRASLHRLLRSLEEAGYLAQEGREYRLGTKTVTLANRISQSTHTAELTPRAHPILVRLASDTAETVILAALSDSRQEMVYADVIVADSPLQYAVPSGDRRPLYSSAAGKAVLAFMPAEEQANYITTAEFRAITPFTTKREQLPEILAKIRSSGVIHDRDGHFVGAGAIASPIFNARGEVFAAVVIAGPSDRLDRIATTGIRLVREAAEEISRAMGFADAYPPPLAAFT